MGQAFDHSGNLLGAMYAETKREVFDKLIERYPDADRLDIRSVPAQTRESSEEQNAQVGTFSFGHAIRLLKLGCVVQRSGWNGKGMWLGLKTPQAQSEMGLPYIYMSTVDGRLVPWLASQTDVLADDWSEVRGVGKEVAL